MSAERYSLDTNLLVYAIDRDAGGRHLRAAEIVDQAIDHDCLLAQQVLAEFFHTVTRKGKMPLDAAVAQIEDWQQLFTVITPRADTLNHAVTAVTDHGLSFWDAMLWATLRPAGVTVLLSEDFQNGRSLGGVSFLNPLTGDENVW
ncbi:PIN domain-containing protein [Endothiovibrio diazotrophicus]